MLTPARPTGPRPRATRGVVAPEDTWYNPYKRSAGNELQRPRDGKGRCMARILVIDDEPDVREVIRTLLEESGHEVVVASEGSEGLQRHQEQPADVVITDLHMPGMNGVETVKRFRDDFGDVKLIAISGADTYMVEKNLESSRINGADRTLMKPFNAADLFAAIDDLLAEA